MGTILSCLEARDVFPRCVELPAGYMTVGNKPAPRKGVIYAHRHVYEQMYGSIPAKHEIHHTCGNRACVNPEHLVAMTRWEHIQEHRVTHCKNGHEFPPESKVEGVWRRCSICRAEYVRARCSTPEYRERRNALRRKRRAETHGAPLVGVQLRKALA